MKPALVLVDFQQDYLGARDLQHTPDALVARAAALLEGCRRRHIPVVHVWTTVRPDDDRRLPHWKADGRRQCVDGSAGHDAPVPLRPVEGETIVHKTGFDGFARGELEAALARAGCTEAIVAGLHLHACVRALVVGCLDRGLAVIVVDDAVASNDPIHAACTRRWLSERCVRFMPVPAVLSHLDGAELSMLVHRSPRQTDVVLFDVPMAGPPEVAAAAARGRAAWAAWRHTGVGARQLLLERFANRLEQAAPELARQMALEIGKPLSHGLEEARRAAACVRDVIRHAGASPPRQSGAAGAVRHQPVGVVAVITPWNNPVAIPAGKIAPALIYGNTVVWKPAPAATGLARAMLRLLSESGAPTDTAQMLTGDRTTAQRLAADPHIDAVTFTGSALAGMDLQEICARRVVPLQAELGGNNAAILWDDAGLPRAAAQIAWGAFGFAGQRCTANRRVIVSAAQAERLWHELSLAAGRLLWHDPLDPASEIGPVIHREKRDDLIGQIDRAQADGGAHRVARLFEPRAAEPWVRAGAYAQPTLVACDVPDHPIVQEETMGPLLVVQRADDFDHALALCNGVRHGLAAALFTHDAELQQRFLADAQAGILKLNTSTAGVDGTLPFGGWKASGIGPPEHGTADWMFYTRMQTVYA